MSDPWSPRRLRSPLAGVLLAGLAALLPFLDKPYHIDDPLFLWAARHIQSHPADFYGFDVNWYGVAMPMSQVTQNPPGACYYTALAAAVVGWGEPALHAAFLLPALAALWGTYRLAELFGGRPALAALLTLGTPVFLVSSTSVMCDVLMLALWVWAVVSWERGARQGRPALLYAAGALIGLCALTKYFGMCLIPLLAAYSLAARRPLRSWLGPLLVAVLILAGYHFLTLRLYGHSLLDSAAQYAKDVRAQGRAAPGGELLTALVFLGGGVAGVACLLPWLFSRRALAVLAAAGVLLLLLSLDLIPSTFRGRGLLAVQAGALATVGLIVLTVAAADLWARRDPPSLLLFFWVLGTFVFAGYVNWTVNSRSILPLAPAVAVLVTRRLNRRSPGGGPRRLPLALLPAAGLALLVAWADYTMASAVRRNAERVAAAASGATGARWFQGHWGFQYYLQQHGWRPWDFRNHPPLAPGDLMAEPFNNTNVLEGLLPPRACALWTSVESQPCRWLSTMNGATGAGFYASVIGPLPFALGPVPPERCRVLEVTANLPAAGAAPAGEVGK